MYFPFLGAFSSQYRFEKFSLSKRINVCRVNLDVGSLLEFFWLALIFVIIPCSLLSNSCCDICFYRPGVLNGAVGVGKSDGISQQIGLGMRSSIPRTDPDNTSLTTERRDRPVGSDKERVNLRTVNKYV